MQAILKKLFYKGQSPVVVLNAPAEGAALAKALGAKAMKGEAAFILAYAKDMASAEKAAKAALKQLADGGIFWLAYPKGSSKKYKGADINRDSGHAALAKLGWDGVSLVALDDDWSAMRFKKKA
jgi:hypothetical protein